MLYGAVFHGYFVHLVTREGVVGVVAGALHAIAEPCDGGQDAGQVPPLLFQHCCLRHHLPLPTAHGNTFRPFQKVTGHHKIQAVSFSDIV